MSQGCLILSFRLPDWPTTVYVYFWSFSTQCFFHCTVNTTAANTTTAPTNDRNPKASSSIDSLSELRSAYLKVFLRVFLLKSSSLFLIRPVWKIRIRNSHQLINCITFHSRKVRVGKTSQVIIIQPWTHRHRRVLTMRHLPKSVGTLSSWWAVKVKSGWVNSLLRTQNPTSVGSYVTSRETFCREPPKCVTSSKRGRTNSSTDDTRRCISSSVSLWGWTNWSS